MLKRDRTEKFFYRGNGGQSASELAIFGAILMFVIGLVLQMGFSSSMSLNEQLKAMRIAFLESYKTGQGAYVNHMQGAGPAARNSASIMVVEDRLAVDPTDKFQTRNRIPFVAGAGGSFTQNLFAPVHNFENYSLPVQDVIVDGQRFPFTMAAFRDVDFSTDLPACNAVYAYYWGVNADGKSVSKPNVPYYDPYRAGKIKPGDPNPGSGSCWWNGGKLDGVSVDVGAYLYKIVGNYTGSTPAFHADSPGGSVKYNFDLNFDGKLDNGTYDPPTVLQVACASDNSIPCFSWQWQEVNGNDLKLNKDTDGTYLAGEMADVDGDGKDETVFRTSKCEYDPAKNSLDYLLRGSNTTKTCSSLGTVYAVTVLDSQAGNIDGTYDTRSQEMNEPKPGLQNDIQMFSFTKSGTMYRIEEGKLYSADTGQYIRNTNLQDHVDIIQRVFQLSNLADNPADQRFCQDINGTWSPRTWGDSTWAEQHGLYGLVNPVEACNNCFSKNNKNNQKTCLDINSKIIFIRSRIQDLRGRRWITRFENMK